MITRKISYVDYNGVKREEEHSFHLNDAEVIKWMTTTGEYTLDKLILRLTQEKNGKRIMEIFEDLLHRSYGVVSLDGRKFEKSEEAWLDFYQTEGYSKIFVELVTNAKAAASFINGIIPKEIAEEVQKAFSENKEGLPAELKDYVVDFDSAIPGGDH